MCNVLKQMRKQFHNFCDFSFYEIWSILYSKLLESWPKGPHKLQNYRVLLWFCSRLDKIRFRTFRNFWNNIFFNFFGTLFSSKYLKVTENFEYKIDHISIKKSQNGYFIRFSTLRIFHSDISAFEGRGCLHIVNWDRAILSRFWTKNNKKKKR